MRYAKAKVQFLEDLRLSGAAKTTVITYQSWLNRYERYVADHGYHDAEVTEAFGVSLLREYRKSLNHLANKTIWSAFHLLRSLGDVLAESGAINRNTAKSVPMPEKKSPPRELVSDAHIKALVGAVNRLRAPRDVAFMRALLYTLLFTGVRATELVSIRLRDLNREEQTLNIRGKGNKWRELSPPHEFWTAIAAWLRERTLMGCSHEWLFAQDRGRGISDEGLRDYLEELKALADPKDEDHIKPHALRHWFARNMHRNGATVPAVQAALGHSNPITTFIYLGLNKPDTRQMRRFASLPALTMEEAIDAECAVIHASDERASNGTAKPERSIAPRPRRIAVR